MKTVAKIAFSMMIVSATCVANAGLWSKLGLGKLAAKTGAHGVTSAAVRGGEALTRVTLQREASKRSAVVAAKSISGTIAKEATPGRIFATGAGVATVTAAHELADGGQTVLEETAKTIRENPDKADSLIGILIEPVNRAVIVVTLAVIGILVWFFYPWISLVRNWSKWRAAKAVRRRRGEAVGEQDSNGSAIEVKARSGKIRYGLLFGLTFLGLLFLTAFAALYPDDARYLPKSMRDNPAYIEEISALHERFQADVQKISEAKFGEIRHDVPKIADEFGTFSMCKSLVWNLAVDKFKGGDRTGECVRRKLEEGYYARLYSSRDELLGLVTKLRSEVKAIGLKYAGEDPEAIERVDAHAEQLYHEVLIEVGEDVEEKKQNLKFGQISMAISTAFEVICVRQTVSTVSKIFGRAVARMSVSATAGGCLALADGPLPIGDIIGGALVVGGTIWTAWDVYQGTKVLPRELEGSLYAGVDKCEKYSVEEALAAGRKILNAYGLKCP